MSRRWKFALASTLMLAVPAVAAPVPAKPAVESPVAKARAALTKTVTAKSDGKSFVEAVDLLKEATKVEITLDTNAIQMMGMDPHGMPVVKFELKDAKLKDALKTAFGPFNLKYGVTASGIVISTEEGVITRQLRQRVDVAAEGKPLADVLKGLADETGANVVIDPRAKKLADEKITLNLDDVPMETAVRLSAEVAGASVVRMSNVLFVTTEARADKLRADADRPTGPTPANPVFPFEGPGGIGIAPGGGPIPPIQVLPGAVPPPAVDLPAQPPAQPPPPPPGEKKER